MNIDELNILYDFMKKNKIIKATVGNLALELHMDNFLPEHDFIEPEIKDDKDSKQVDYFWSVG